MYDELKWRRRDNVSASVHGLEIKHHGNFILFSRAGHFGAVSERTLSKFIFVSRLI